jgi:ABC-type sugar transport system ATPase subunit
MNPSKVNVGVVVDHVVKHYGGNPRPALDDVAFTIEPGELLAVLGPSGSGKTTMLNVLAGLEGIDSGRLLFGERDVTRLPPEQRNIAVVFQSSMLYPHLRLRDSIAFAPRLKKVPEAEIAARIEQVTGWLRIPHLLDRRPSEVSGGERQRAAIAKALVSRPALLLMDEPFSAVDAQLRRQLRTELVKLHREFGTTTVFVTHDQEEALAISDRVAVMRNGKLAQLSDPLTLYRRPESAWVADFVAVNPFNLLPAGLRDKLSLKVPQTAAPSGFDLGLRPETIRIKAGGPQSSLRVYTREVIAGQLKYTLRATDGSELVAVTDNNHVFQVDTPVEIGVDWPYALAFDPANGNRLDLVFGESHVS